MMLVQSIVDWIKANTTYFSEMAILVASPSSSINACPPNIGGSVPDVFAQSAMLSVTIIGEAKTATDVETLRSRKQFADYLRFLANQENPLLVIAVPWQCVNQAKTLLRSIQRKTNTDHVKVQVLEKLPG